jgi:RimJ/RimL family protein N-acetyltransferase
MEAKHNQPDVGTAQELVGHRVTLERFDQRHITDRYLAWLIDPVVNQYSRRLGVPAPDYAQAMSWLAGLQKDEVVYAVCLPSYGHVGNIKYGPIHWTNLSADISILLGAREIWGQGLGAEAIYLVTRHLFVERGVNRLSAASINPAFVRMVEKLGWQREGIQREESIVGGIRYDSTLLSHLYREFVIRPELEKVDA